MKDYWHDTCPRCGATKYHRSALCAKCRSEQRQPKPSKHKKDVCPQCGRPKLITSQVCRACATGKDVNLAAYRGRSQPDLPAPAWEAVSHEWLVQFAGLLLGEGCVHTRLSPGGTLSLNLFIKLRADDRSALEDIQRALGGSVKVYRPYMKTPEAVWTVTKAKDIQAILVAVRALIVIPMRKAIEFDIALEYFAWRATVGFHHVDRAKIAEFHARLTSAKLLSA